MTLRNLFFLALLPVCLTGRAEVIENLHYKPYRVEHQSGTSLAKAINAATPFNEGGHKYHGYTKWHISWRYRFDTTASGSCKITSATVNLDATISLPELSSSDQSAKKQFDTYLPALKKHETGHYQISQEAAKKVERTLLAQPAMPNCELLKTTLNQRGEAVLDEARAQDRQYDASTSHGRTQGAWLDH
ncbi:DUF922 domain-containing protein [Undibacterium sp. TS12]|uniref:DUF922 domain-containing Zn-dependent protease n=1 Tax=Undibacterium sp. TS12 TaxID=2908202 RepID=UPI001F4C6765|nr:DUF922 domain-containing protein [Undibacterium sp. TS12]MCH8620391.1 DUF922 domain-containing Zn-dependent protease [Undibacterium sp. TS12]